MKRIKRSAHIVFMVLMLAIAISVVVFGAVKRVPHTQAQINKNHEVHPANKRPQVQLHYRM